LCLGYNSLSDTTAILGDHHTEDTKEDPEATAVSGNKPKGARKWTWLVLCDDGELPATLLSRAFKCLWSSLGTIISIFETPFPDHRGALTETQQSLLCAIRRNLHNVFKQLSKVNDAHRKDNPINTLDIRPGLESNQQSNIKIADSPSILFYYLFDDWYTSYALVAKSEHQYAHQLETLVSHYEFSKHTLCPNVGSAQRHVREAPRNSYQPVAPIWPGVGRSETDVPELCTHHRTRT